MSALLYLQDRPAARAAPAGRRADAVPLGEALTDLPAWTDLADAALEPSVFSGPAMAAAAAGTVEQEHWTAVRAFDGDRLDGLLLVRPAWSIPLVGPRLVDGFHSHYGPRNPPLLRRDCPDAADRLVEALAAEAKVVRLANQALEGPATAAITAAVLRRGGEVVVADAHHRALLEAARPAAEAVGPSLVGRRLRDLDRQWRRLGDPVHRHETEPGPIDAALEAFIDLEQLGWKGARRSALADDGRRLAFARRLVHALAADERVRADTLAVDGRIVAVVLTLVSGDTGFFWKIAHDPALAAFSPGVQVARRATLRLLADPAIRVVDSLATADHPLMDRLWNGRIAIGTLFLALDAGAVPLARRLAAAHETHMRLRGEVRRLAARLRL